MLVIKPIKFKLNGLEKKVKEIENAKFRTEVGFFPRATYADGKKVAYIAYLNEFGDHNPPRPFMKRTAENRKEVWAKVFYNALKNNLTRDGIYKAHKDVGIAAEGDIKQTIREWNPNDPRPNKPATIRRKARRARGGEGLVPIDPYTALIDSGVMLKSVESEVKDV